jgi:squalene-hopene/tetraprenyl-beta-curcumene cyclase
MLTFQCKDGGWASFDKDCTKGILEKVPFADHNAMLDPECADITARILELLGYENFELQENPQVRKAMEFIREHQEEDGSWYGRWGVNYIYGTWQVLRGLRALGMDMRQPWLLKRARLAGERATRGRRLGRTLRHVRRPGLQGPGAQHRLANRLGRHGPVRLRGPQPPERPGGHRHLIRTQNADGTWTELEATGTGFPRVFYLKYDMYRNSWPLLALATYRNLLPSPASDAVGNKPKPAAKLSRPAAGDARSAVSWFYRSLIRPVLFAQETRRGFTTARCGSGLGGVTAF